MLAAGEVDQVQPRAGERVVELGMGAFRGGKPLDPVEHFLERALAAVALEIDPGDADVVRMPEVFEIRSFEACEEFLVGHASSDRISRALYVVDGGGEPPGRRRVSRVPQSQTEARPTTVSSGLSPGGGSGRHA